MDDSADRDLIRRVRRGEDAVYGELVRRYQQSVFNVCYRVLRDLQDAEDLAQEAFIRAYERLDRYDAERPFGPWVRRLAANLAINALNHRKPALALDENRDGGSSPAYPQPEAALIGKERSLALQEALGRLPAHYRMAIELRHFQEMDYQQMSAALGLPLNTAKSHLYRARKLLADLMEDRT